MDFSDMNWMQVEAYLAEDNRLMIVLGATEQHGYLSLAADVLIPHRLAQAAAAETGVLIIPPLPFGSSPYFLGYPGTISLRMRTFLAVLEDILASVYRHGFRHIVVLNGHGGNRGAKAAFDEAANDMPGLKAFWYNWWLSPAVQKIASEAGLAPSHANWLEAFEFTRVTELPGEEKPVVDGIPSLHANLVRRHYGDGSFGGTYQAPRAVMDEIFNACLQEVVDLLEA
jgi:creatinine amidohydrolase